MNNRTIALFAAALFWTFTPTCFSNTEIQSNNELVITAGSGLSACPIGCEKHQFASLFSEAKNIGNYVLAPNYGIEASIKRGHVAAVFFFFNTNQITKPDTRTLTVPREKLGVWDVTAFGAKADFIGRTDTGIGADSSIDDVIKSYGKPDEHRKGRSPYEKEEISLGYSSKGISFTFINNRLSDIRVFSPPQTPPVLSITKIREKLVGEWQLNLHSGNQGLPFREGFLTGNFGAVLTLNPDETASYAPPCDINETLNTKLRLGGQWRLTDEGFFSISLQSDGVDFPIKGQLWIDEQSDEIDHLIIVQEKGKFQNFGRFSHSSLNCN